MKQDAGAQSPGSSPKAKRETSVNNQEPKKEFLQVIAQTRSPRRGATQAGAGNQPGAWKH